jgi:hypothetical protein
VRIGAFLGLTGLLIAGPLAAPAVAASPLPPQPLTRDAQQVYEWVARTRDHRGLPFMILDKKRAHLWVYDRNAKLRGDAPVLLGSARGDHTVPGIGELKLSQIRPEDRTTPAGRFLAETGKNERGETVVWVDYDNAVSMHPVLTANPAERRKQRLDTPTPADNRVSFGCINVPTDFHAKVVLGTVGRSNSVVYILPETRPLASVFRQLGGTRPAASAPAARVAAQ